MLTKWELTKWELTKWEIDEVGIDKVGIDKVGRSRVACRDGFSKKKLYGQLNRHSSSVLFIVVSRNYIFNRMSSRAEMASALCFLV